MEKNMEENNLKGAGKTPGTADQAETPQTPIKRNTKNSSRKNMGIPLQRSLVRAVHLQVCIFLLW